MAVDWKGGLGGAAQGAAIGSAVPVIGTGVGAVVGGLLGLFGGGEDDAAAEAQRKAIEAIQSLDVDDLSKQALLQQYMTGGKLDPELVEKLNLNADQKMVLTEKPETIAKQTYALNALKQMAQGTGMSAESLAQMQQLTGKLSQDRAAASADVLAKAQARGTLGSGEMLAAQLGASQLGSQEASENAINIAAQAEKARKDALSQYRGLAGEMRTAEFDTMQKNLQNELARQRFLDENSLAAQKANVAQRQRANEYNLQRQQNVSDLNVQAANQEAIRSANLRAELAYKKAMGLSNAYGGSRDFEQKRAEAEAASDDKFWSGLTTGVKSLSNEGVFGKTGKDSEYDTWGILGVKKHQSAKQINQLLDMASDQIYNILAH